MDEEEEELVVRRPRRVEIESDEEEESVGANGEQQEEDEEEGEAGELGEKNGEDVVEEVRLQRRQTKLKKALVKEISEGGKENKFRTWTFDVILGDASPSTSSQLYRIQLPTRKVQALVPNTAVPRARYKKKVKMLELAFEANTSSGSFDRKQAEHLGVLKRDPDTKAGRESHFDYRDNNIFCTPRYEEVYEGRSFSSPNDLHYAAGFLKDGKFYVAPVVGHFDMRRTVSKKTRAEGEKRFSDDFTDGETEESEAETQAVSVGTRVRVKFARPESERQKKRREASALYRGKLIAQDEWLPMRVDLGTNEDVKNRVETMVCGKEPEIIEDSEEVPIRVLVGRTLGVGEKNTSADTSKNIGLISMRGLSNLPPSEQVKVLLIKTHVMSTSQAAEQVSDSILCSQLLEDLSACAHLVQGLWVVDSELLHPGDDPKNEILRDARDFALSLLDAGATVTRQRISKTFRLSSDDVDAVLSSVGVRDESSHSWKLPLPADTIFAKNPANVGIVLREKRYWAKRFDEIRGKVSILTVLEWVDEESKPKKRYRRQSGKATSPPKIVSMD